MTGYSRAPFVFDFVFDCLFEIYISNGFFDLRDLSTPLFGFGVGKSLLLTLTFSVNGSVEFSTGAHFSYLMLNVLGDTVFGSPSLSLFLKGVFLCVPRSVPL